MFIKKTIERARKVYGSMLWTRRQMIEEKLGGLYKIYRERSKRFIRKRTGRKQAMKDVIIPKTDFYREGSSTLLLKYFVYKMCQLPAFKEFSARRLSDPTVVFTKPVNFFFQSTIGTVFSTGDNQISLEKEIFEYSSKGMQSLLSFQGTSSDSDDRLDYYSRMIDMSSNVEMFKQAPLVNLTMSMFIARSDLKALSVAQKRLEQLFVDIAGEDISASITQKQFKKYLKDRLKIKDVAEEEVEGLFEWAGGKEGKLSALDYWRNIHAYCIECGSSACPAFIKPALEDGGEQAKVLPLLSITQANAPAKHSQLLLRIAGMDPSVCSRIGKGICRIERTFANHMKHKQKFVIAAEDSEVQTAIESLSRQLRIQYFPNVFIIPTFQVYLREGRRQVLLHLRNADCFNQALRINLVKGDYLLEENRKALEEDRETATYVNKAGVDKEFDEMMKKILKQVQSLPEQDSLAIISTQNSHSIRKAAKLLNNKKDKRVMFGRLKGMKEHCKRTDKMNYLMLLPYGHIYSLYPYIAKRINEVFLMAQNQKFIIKDKDVWMEIIQVRKWHITAGLLLALKLTAVLILLLI